MKKTAVFGGSGFIGKHLISKLIETKRYVYNCDNTFDKYYNNKNIEFVNVNALSRIQIIETLKDVDEIVDLVYTTSPKTSFDDPITDIIDNLPMNVNILKTALELKNLSKFVYVSSGGTVYGNTEEKLINEEHPTNPISPYGITKLASEKYGFMFHKIYELPFIAIRPSNAFGIGQRIDKAQGFIAHAINSIMSDREIVIFGKNGTIRDYIYVSDIAQALLAILDYGELGNIYNVGTGIGTSNLKLVEKLTPLARAINKDIKIKILDERPFDVKQNILNINKILKSTNWEPKINLDKGLNLTFNWFTAQLKTSKSI